MVRDSQFSNAYSSMAVTVDGIERDVSFLQLEKALRPMVVKPASMTTLVLEEGTLQMVPVPVRWRMSPS